MYNIGKPVTLSVTHAILESISPGHVAQAKANHIVQLLSGCAVWCWKKVSSQTAVGIFLWDVAVPQAAVWVNQKDVWKPREQHVFASIPESRSSLLCPLFLPLIPSLFLTLSLTLHKGSWMLTAMPTNAQQV